MNDRWLENLKSNLSTERKVLVSFLKQLADVEQKKLFAEKGYSSLFSFCTQELGLAEGCAFKRIRTARLAKIYPVILDMIATGETHMSTVVLLKPIMTGENHLALLNAAKGKSKRDVEMIVAKALPKPDICDSIRKLPEKPQHLTVPGDTSRKKTEATPLGEPERSSIGDLLCFVDETSEKQTPILPEKPKETFQPLSEERYQIKFSASKNTADKIEKVKQLLSHKFPEGKFENLMDEILDFYLERNDPEKRKIKNIQSTDTGTHSRYIPQNVKTLVWQRDRGQCSFVSKEGRRCEAKSFLEYDHKTEFARGGSSKSVSNLQLLCRTHNQLRAEKTFGKFQKNI